MPGITPKIINELVRRPGDLKHPGFGYKPNEVGEMTLDQIWMTLANPKLLRSTGKKSRVRSREIKGVESLAVQTFVKPDADGFYKGRAKDGTPIKAKILGKSKAKRLAEQFEAEAAERRKLAKDNKRKKRRGK